MKAEKRRREDVESTEDDHQARRPLVHQHGHATKEGRSCANSLAKGQSSKRKLKNGTKNQKKGGKGKRKGKGKGCTWCKGKGFIKDKGKRKGMAEYQETYTD